MAQRIIVKTRYLNFPIVGYAIFPVKIRESRQQGISVCCRLPHGTLPFWMPMIYGTRNFWKSCIATFSNFPNRRFSPQRLRSPRPKRFFPRHILLKITIRFRLLTFLMRAGKNACSGHHHPYFMQAFLSRLAILMRR